MMLGISSECYASKDDRDRQNNNGGDVHLGTSSLFFFSFLLYRCDTYLVYVLYMCIWYALYVFIIILIEL